MNTYREIQQFLYREARIMDEHRYQDWLDLWTSDAHYWIPCNDEDGDINDKIALVNERRAGVEDRVKRLCGTGHYAQEPKSRMSRVVSNIEILEDSDDRVVVASVFSLTAIRRGKTDIVAGRTTHWLTRSGDDYRISAKKILLAGNNEVMTNLTFLV